MAIVQDVAMDCFSATSLYKARRHIILGTQSFVGARSVPRAGTGKRSDVSIAGRASGMKSLGRQRIQHDIDIALLRAMARASRVSAMQRLCIDASTRTSAERSSAAGAELELGPRSRLACCVRAAMHLDHCRHPPRNQQLRWTSFW